MPPIEPSRPDRQLLVIQQLFDLVIASSRSPRQRERLNRAAGLPMTESGSMLLRSIKRHGPITLNELAARLDLDPSTVSRQVQNLDAQGLIDRRPDPSDRRSALITLSDKGTVLLDRVRAIALNDYEAALSSWSIEDRSALATLLERLRDDLMSVEVDDRGWSKVHRTV